jgi:hypothetical protein
MHTLGSSFTPPGFHAGGLRYHGMAPLVSHLLQRDVIEAIALTQNKCFEAGAEIVRAAADSRSDASASQGLATPAFVRLVGWWPLNNLFMLLLPATGILWLAVRGCATNAVVAAALLIVGGTVVDFGGLRC